MTEPEDETPTGLPNFPNHVRDAAHLEQLLRAALDSLTHGAADETLEQMRQEVRRRHAAQHP